MRIAKHWSHDGKVLKIFNVYGYIHESELYLGEARECMTKAMPHERASSALSSRLTNLDNGYGKNKILYIQINEYTAQLLFAEGILNIQMLKDADEDDKSIFVPMIFNSHRRIIAIRNDLPQAILFFGPNGKPLKIY